MARRWRAAAVAGRIFACGRGVAPRRRRSKASLVRGPPSGRIRDFGKRSVMAHLRTRSPPRTASASRRPGVRRHRSAAGRSPRAVLSCLRMRQAQPDADAGQLRRRVLPGQRRPSIHRRRPRETPGRSVRPAPGTCRTRACDSSRPPRSAVVAQFLGFQVAAHGLGTAGGVLLVADQRLRRRLAVDTRVQRQSRPAGSARALEAGVQVDEIGPARSACRQTRPRRCQAGRAARNAAPGRQAPERRTRRGAWRCTRP